MKYFDLRPLFLVVIVLLKSFNIIAASSLKHKSDTNSKVVNNISTIPIIVRNSDSIQISPQILPKYIIHAVERSIISPETLSESYKSFSRIVLTPTTSKSKSVTLLSSPAFVSTSQLNVNNKDLKRILIFKSADEDKIKQKNENRSKVKNSNSAKENLKRIIQKIDSKFQKGMSSSMILESQPPETSKNILKFVQHRKKRFIINDLKVNFDLNEALGRVLVNDPYKCSLFLVCELSRTPINKIEEDEKIILEFIRDYVRDEMGSNDLQTKTVYSYASMIGAIGREMQDDKACNKVYNLCPYSSNFIMQILRARAANS